MKHFLKTYKIFIEQKNYGSFSENRNLKVILTTMLIIT